MGCTTHFETLVMERLAACELSRRELAERLGYRNPGTAHNLVVQWRRGTTTPQGGQFDRLANALGIEPGEVEAAKRADKLAAQMRAEQLLADFPAYRLRIRIIYGRYANDTLPEGISEAEAVERASMIASRWKRTVCMTSPGLTSHFWFDKCGKLISRGNGSGPSIFGGWMEGMWLAAQHKKATQRAAQATQDEKGRYFKPDRSDRPTSSEDPFYKILEFTEDAGRLADGRPYIYESAYSAGEGVLLTYYYFDATDLENADTLDLILLFSRSGIDLKETPFGVGSVHWGKRRIRDAKGRDTWELLLTHVCDE